MKISEIAALVNGDLQGDGSQDIIGIAALTTAGPADLAYAEAGRALEQAKRSRAGCILVPPQSALEGKTIIRVTNPKLALIKATEMVLPSRRAEPGIDPTAVIGAGVSLAPGVSVGAQTVIEDGVTIDESTCVASGVSIGRGVGIGAHCVIHPRVTIYSNVRIGSRVVIHAGAVIGADGFGYVFAEGRHQKFPQLGKVIIEDDIEIGSNVSIDRGSLGDTMIGEGTKIDNLVQIAHNVHIGRHCVIAAQTGISGSVEVGNYVVIGGQVGIGDRVRIEDQAVIGAQAGIPTSKVVRRGSAMWGTPARPMSEFKKTYAQISNLPNLAKKVKQLAERLAAKSNTTDTKR